MGAEDGSDAKNSVLHNASNDGRTLPVSADYANVVLREIPDFSNAKITGITLSHHDEVAMRVAVGSVIEAGNNLLGYSRQELHEFCGIRSAQFSKIIRGESWMNIASQGMWGFATGINPTDVAQLTPLKADPATCITYYLNGHLHHLDNDEFELINRLICRRFAIGYSPVNTLGIEIAPKLTDEAWRAHYLKNLIEIVAQRVVELRSHLGFSQKTFADVMGVSTETVKHYESGSGRLSKGVFTTYRLYATLNVNPIELTVGSLHHKIRYIQEQRHLALLSLVKQIDYNRYTDLKACALGIKKL